MAKPNMADIFKQAQKMQDEMTRVQESLEQMTVEGAAGGGVITATANGKQKLVSIQIDPEVIQSDDKEMLEDLVVAAVNQALDKAQEMSQEEMQKVAGGMLGNLPMGGMKLPGLNL
ncbi:YbaB/EbfC family nucleoid-associated protein [candidate division KSB1 bacterium]|nr:YbaB/EbfC family nucleoid-associated protein [candidate division KSB1 bacterium]